MRLLMYINYVGVLKCFLKKQNSYWILGGSESQDFDAQIADATITMIPYLFLGNKEIRIGKFGRPWEIWWKPKRPICLDWDCLGEG